MLTTAVKMQSRRGVRANDKRRDALTRGVQEFRMAQIAKLQAAKRPQSRISDQPCPVQCRLLTELFTFTVP